jgi:hypothetical protein
MLAKRGVAARNGMLVAGMATLAVGDLFFAFVHSPLGEKGRLGRAGKLGGGRQKPWKKGWGG